MKASTTPCTHINMKSTRPLNPTSTVMRRIEGIWKSFQVSRKGIYTVEAVEAFQEYSDKPWIKSFGLLLAVPIPAVVFLIGLECIPFASPNAGWKANYMFYLRATIFEFTCVLSCCIQLLRSHSEASVSMQVLIFTSVIITAWLTGAIVLFGYVWTFPIPFCLLILTIVGATCIVVVLLIISHLHSSSNYITSSTLIITLKFLFAEAALICTYPAFSSVFVRLRGFEQACFVLVLPVIKVVMKNFIANLFLNTPENIIHTTVFSVELFNAFYVSTCMQTAVSPWSTVILLCYDILSSIWSLISIQKTSQKVYELQSKLNRQKRDDLLFMVLGNLPNKSKSLLTSGDCASKKEVRDRKISRVNPHIAEKIASSKPGLSILRQAYKEAAVVPFSPTKDELVDKISHTLPGPARNKLGSKKQMLVSEQARSLLLQQTQSLLFRCEYMASLEYVEFVVPFIYIIYMSVLFHLPNAKYHANFRYLNEDTLYSSIGSIALYGGLELLSFIAFVSYIQWKFGFSPVKLLGFNFEAQGSVVIARSTLFLLFVAQFPYPHFGVDPTFQFDYSDYP